MIVPEQIGPPKRGVLIVDDEPRIRALLNRLMVDAGYSPVLQAENGVQALSILAAHSEEILVVLLDLAMPELDGMEVMKHLVNVHSRPVGVIVVTGHPAVMTVKRFFALGTPIVLAANYIFKPFSSEAICTEVERTLTLIEAKRNQMAELAAGDFSVHVNARLERIESALSRISNQSRGFLTELGLDLVRALVIAAALFALLLLGVDDFVRKVLNI